MTSPQESVDLISSYDEAQKEQSSISIITQENTGVDSSQQVSSYDEEQKKQSNTFIIIQENTGVYSSQQVDLINSNDEEQEQSSISIVTQENTGVDSSDLADVDHLTVSILPSLDLFDFSRDTVKEQEIMSKDSPVDHDGSEEEELFLLFDSNSINNRIIESNAEGTDDSVDKKNLTGEHDEISKEDQTSESGLRESQSGDVSMIKSEVDGIITRYRNKMAEVLNNSHSEFDTQMDRTYDDMIKDADNIGISAIIGLINDQLKDIFQVCADHFAEIELNLGSEVRGIKERESKIKSVIDIAIDKKIIKLLENDRTTQIMSGVASLIETRMNEYAKDFSEKVDRIEGDFRELGIAKAEDKGIVEAITETEHRMNDRYEYLDKKVSVIEKTESMIRENALNIDTMVATLQGNLSQLDERFSSMKDNQFEKLNLEVEKLSKRVVEYFCKISEVEKESYVLREDIEKIKSENDASNSIDYVREGLGKLESKYDELKDQYAKLLEARPNMEESMLSVEQRLRDEFDEIVNGIVRQLEEDRADKWKQIVEAVKDEAGKVMERIEIMESVEGVLREELTAKEEEIKEIIGKDRVTFDQTIQEKVRETIDSYTTECEERLRQQIREAMRQYEEKVNKLSDSSFELEQTFTGEIRTLTDRKIRSIEIENNKLKDSKRHYKEKLVQKESDISDLKVCVNQYESQVCKLEQEKTYMEKKINDIKLEKRQIESKVKELECRYHEVDKRFQTKFMSNEEELRKIKIEYERQEKRLQKNE
ncbi:9781_t:CDS:2 [Acaulospora colombiana]|uniref:9781_t:CDS:1 n=1 Tax=Acaulospora colombiana TaxID=27376 RepID=A0ACA9K1R6_9GLOM|nr:9781_t:CDS:2 [Acaulospora colombiana]